MSDFNSSQPVRTETNGDIVAKLVDFSINTQGLVIDASGFLSSKLFDGAGIALTSQASGGQRALDVGINVSGVQIDPRSIRALTSSDVVTAAQGAPNTNVNGWFVRLTDGTNNASITAGGALAVSISNDVNYGVVGANTLRTAAQIGNATGAANFGAGTTGAQTLRVASNLYDSTGTAFSPTNPLPVTIDTIVGTPVNDFKDAVAVALSASDAHIYTVTAGKTLYLTQVEIAASGIVKAVTEIETGVATGSYITYFTQFTTASSLNASLRLSSQIAVAAGVRVRVTLTNRDKVAQDLYSTICGYEK